MISACYGKHKGSLLHESLPLGPFALTAGSQLLPCWASQHPVTDVFFLPLHFDTSYIYTLLPDISEGSSYKALLPASALTPPSLSALNTHPSHSLNTPSGSSTTHPPYMTPGTRSLTVSANVNNTIFSQYLDHHTPCIACVYIVAEYRWTINPR